jgi:hypothetical protein
MCQRKSFTITIFAVMLLAGNSSIAQTRKLSGNREKPNVIFILADDLGRGLLSHYGQEIVHTPNIDRLATEGVSFETLMRAPIVRHPAQVFLLAIVIVEKESGPSLQAVFMKKWPREN